MVTAFELRMAFERIQRDEREAAARRAKTRALIEAERKRGPPPIPISTRANSRQRAKLTALAREIAVLERVQSKVNRGWERVPWQRVPPSAVPFAALLGKAKLVPLAVDIRH